MNKIITDSSVLILLEKCGLLETLCDAYKVIAPSSVIDEVASPELQSQYLDAKAIYDLVKSEKVIVHSPKSPNIDFPVTLGLGEKDALLLAHEIDKSLFATDDRKAIKTAKYLNLPFIITPRIIIDLFHSKKIQRKQARQSIEKLSIFGRYSPDIIAHALLTLSEETNDKADNHKIT
jgi:predicted nucleic acid-binding protein